MASGPDDLGPGIPDSAGSAPYASGQTVGGDPRVPVLPALTSAQVSAAPTQADYNKLQTDVTNLHATVAGLFVVTQPGADEGQGSVSGAPTYNSGSGNTANSDLGPGHPDA